MRKWLHRVLGFAIAVNLFTILAYYLSVAPVGTWLLMGIAVFGFIPFLAAVVAIPVSLVCLFWRKLRVIGLTVLLASLVYLVISVAGIKVANNIRREGFVRLAERSRPLVNAVRGYELKYGHARRSGGACPGVPAGRSPDGYRCLPQV